MEFKTNISENQGGALPPANYVSFTLWDSRISVSSLFPFFVLNINFSKAIIGDSKANTKNKDDVNIIPKEDQNINIASKFEPEISVFELPKIII
uniref:Uncharacterized protein n=1 Tax=Megaselia scalaris TaxID=36166 RepID=T1GGA3_MEGSC